MKSFSLHIDGDKILLGLFTFLTGRQSLRRYVKKRKPLSLLAGILFLCASAGYLVDAFRAGTDEDDEDDYEDIYGVEEEEA